MTSSIPSASLLAIERLNAGYGTKQVLSGVGLEVRAGEIVVVVGPNGAGKTTLLSSISGLCRIMGGHILFKGADVTGWRADRLAAAGIAHCPEGRQIFQQLTVEENLLAAHIRAGAEASRCFGVRCMRFFPSLKNDGPAWRAGFPAANSRCWRSAGR